MDEWKPQSAYQHFYKAVSAGVKHQLTREGKDASLGSLGSTISSKFKELNDDERYPFDELERKDRERAAKEKTAKDKKALLEQEARRAINKVGDIAESRMRATTTAMTENVEAIITAPRKKRELTTKEIKQRNKQAKERKEETDAVQAEHRHLENSRAEQAENRLKYLLNQSDIFAHFGVGKNKKKGKYTAPPSLSSPSSSSDATNGRSRRQAVEGMDEDEEAIAAEVDAQKVAVSITQPKMISGGTMRDYQIEGLQWMVRLFENGINGILADEMGLGKTLQSISIIAHMYEVKDITGPHLILVPKSTLSNWMNEFKRFAPSIRPLRFHGSKDEREQMMKNVIKPGNRHQSRDWDVLITTYEICNLEKNQLQKIAWRYMIIDEAHRLKNEMSQFSQTVRLLDVQNRILLTGTPLQNNLHELWALLNFLLPDVFASSEQFDEWFDLDVDDVSAKQRMISQLHKLLRPFMLRRLKADVEKSLPPKTETILFTGMSALQKTVYKQILLRDMDTINSAHRSKSESCRTAILNIVMQLRKCCNHPYLFPNIEDRSLDPLGSHLWQSCGKTVLLDKLLGKLFERGHRVLIFSQMTRMLDILEDYLWSKQYKYCRIDGNTTYDEREDRIQAYNAPDSDKFIFLLSTRAGGLGINLQTADTVVIYDSDWNPQADLQAQDRAHRIGQKKVVQVFRLVTDDSVEVKVVERAQQKLKLDAMVVQQGRLADQDKKMSKEDLLDTLKFGADKVFRSKDSTVTDDDIDKILEEGKKRTAEMTEKMQLAEKGDMYDFKLDGGMSNQVFEGTDYSDTKNQKAFSTDQPFFLDTGKRERKEVSYSETLNPIIREPRLPREPKARPKLPRHLRLPKMDEWQFFQRKRLHELHNQELEQWEKMIDAGTILPPGQISRTVVLPEDLHNEKNALIAEGFDAWTKVHFNGFIRSSAQNGRTNYEAMAMEVDRPVDECKRFSEKFWRDGSKHFSAVDWDRYVKTVEKGERKQEEIGRLSDATKELIAMFDNPWEELTFTHVGTHGRVNNAIEDRFLLCYTNYYGYGNWDKVRNAIRSSDRFRFNYWITSLPEEALGKRCEQLMRYAEREVKIAGDKQTHLKSASTAVVARNTSRYVITEDGDVTELALKEGAIANTNDENVEDDALVAERLSFFDDITDMMYTESMSYSGTRRDPKVKFGKTMKTEDEVRIQRAQIASAFESTQRYNETKLSDTSGQVNALKLKKLQTINKLPRTTTSKPKKTGSRPGAALKPVPDECLPDLLKIIQKAGSEGMARVVEEFVTMYPTISKRQTELKISEVGVKERRQSNATKQWYVRKEFLHHLKGSGSAVTSSNDAAASSSNSSPKADTNTDDTNDDGSNNDSNVVKNSSEIGQKRKATEDETGNGNANGDAMSDENTTASGNGNDASSAEPATKKAKEAVIMDS